MSGFEKKRTLHPVQTLFDYSEETGKSCCKLCSSRMEGRHSSNLLRHVQRKHEFEYEQVLAERKLSDPTATAPKRVSTGVVMQSTPNLIHRTPSLTPIANLDRGKMKHPVHAYFDYDDFVDKSRCRLCDASFTGKHSQNLVKHLLGKHKECYRHVIEEREKQKSGQVIFPVELKFESDEETSVSLINRRHPVQDLFEYNDIVNKSRCKRCSQIFQGKHSENLLRHVKRKHESDYAEIIVRRAQEGFDSISMAKRPKSELNTTNNHNTPTSNNNSFYKFVPKRLNVGLTAEKLINACVELVTTNGRPYSILGDSGFRKIIDPILKGLGDTIVIDRNTIEAEVRKRAEKLRYELAVALKQKLISLKIDSARNQCDRISLNISVQYIDDEQIVLKNLATREMPIHCPNENLGNIILEVLKEYNLSVSQIYSITTDYGTDICEENFSEMRDQGLLLSIGCIALTLQFAIDDVLKFDEFHFFLLPIRAIIAKLLEPENASYIEKKQLPKPFLDNEADGWSSTLEMLKRFLELKPACLELATTVPELHLNEEDWLKLERMIAALEPAKRAFDVLQTQQLTMTDFYNVWTKCKLESRKIQNNEYSVIMCKSFDGHEVNLMNNVSLLSTMYLDPRFQILLNDWQKQKAKEHLYTVYDKLVKLSQPTDADSIQQNNNCLFPIDQMDVGGKIVSTTPNGDVSIVVTPHIEEEEVDELEAFLMQTEKEKRQFSADFSTEFKMDIMTELDKFNNVERIPLKSNVITYWQTKRISHPQLFSLAQVIFAVPATKTIVDKTSNGDDNDE